METTVGLRDFRVESNKLSLCKIVEECMEIAGGVATAAVVELQKRMDNDRELYALVTAPFVAQAAWQVIRKYAHSERQRLWTAPNDDGKARSEGVHALAQSHWSILLNFRLPIDGLPLLGMATKEQVCQAANFYLQQGKNMTQKGEWLMKIVNLLTSDTKVVKNQVKENDIQKLYNEIVTD